MKREKKDCARIRRKLRKNRITHKKNREEH
jgi:hypothetical protein